jgi:hypothetical protein
MCGVFTDSSYEPVQLQKLFKKETGIFASEEPEGLPEDVLRKRGGRS